MSLLITGLIVVISIIFYERSNKKISIPLVKHISLVINHIGSVLAVVFFVVLILLYVKINDPLFIGLGSLSSGAFAWLYFDYYFSRNKI